MQCNVRQLSRAPPYPRFFYWTRGAFHAPSGAVHHGRKETTRDAVLFRELIIGSTSQLGALRFRRAPGHSTSMFASVACLFCYVSASFMQRSLS